jgi:TRAP-type C4-dicarboxylate transport system permease small subunit
MTYPPQPADDTPASKTRPGTVTVAVWLQILLGVFLIAQAALGLLYAGDAQAAAEAELASQGYDMSDLPEGTTFESSGALALIPIAIGAALIVLALLNRVGNRPARVVTWVLQPIVLLCGGFLAVSQLFLTQFLEAGIDSGGGPDDLDVQALVDALYGAYPAWWVVIDYGAFALATIGSILVIILLATPSANAFFRKEEPQAHIPGAPPA